MSELFNQAIEAGDALKDQTVVQESNFYDEPYPAGPTPARFVGYVETGVHKQNAFEGKEKPDVEWARLWFELNGPSHTREVEVDGVKKTFTNVISIRVPMKFGEKASYMKLFQKMLYGRDGFTHMSHLLGQGFLINIVHNEVKDEKGKVKKVYANMKDADGTWLIGSPSFTNPMTNETQELPVPPMSVEGKMFLWDVASELQWNSIFIDGTRTITDAKGNQREESKNWLQEEILKAKNFPGSPIEALLVGVSDLTLEDCASPDVPEDNEVIDEAPEADVSEPEVEETVAEAEKTEDDPLAKTKGDADASAAALMASLGLS